MRPDESLTDDPVDRLLQRLLAEDGRPIQVGGDTPIRWTIRSRCCW